MQLSGGPQTLCVTSWWFSGSGSKALQSPLWLNYYVDDTFFIMLWKFLWLNPACCGCFFEFRKPICKDMRNMLDWCISPMCPIFHPLRTMECESITNVSRSLSGYNKTTWVDLRQLHASMCCLPQMLQCPAVTCPANPLQIIPNLLGTWQWHHSMPSRLNEVGAEAPKFIMKYHDAV